MIHNCFTIVYKYLNLHYGLPDQWNEWSVNDMDKFVQNKNKFLAKKDHIAFFKSFCKKVKKAQRDDVVLTRTSVGVAINQFMYWVYNEESKKIEHKKLDNDCLIMRLNNG